MTVPSREKDEVDDPADAELHAAAHERLAAARKRDRERADLVHRHHGSVGDQDTSRPALSRREGADPEP